MQKYMSADGVRFSSIIKGIHKSRDYLRPLYEVVLNSIESLNETGSEYPSVLIDFFYAKAHNNERQLQRIRVTDNGLGFNDENFKRFTCLGDNSKSPQNRGSGRVQQLHAFKLCKYESVYSEGGRLCKRVFSLSKDPTFLANNAIVRLDSVMQDTEGEIKTSVDLIEPISEKGSTVILMGHPETGTAECGLLG